MRRFIGVSAALPPFQSFLDEHRDIVWRFLVASVGREDADDCFQETFIAALRAYPRLRGRRREHNLRAWVLAIAHNKALDAQRAKGRRAVPIAEPEAGSAAAEQEQLRDEALWESVAELPRRQRSAVVLRFVGDLSHREIATAIGCSEDAARRSLYEGLTKLRKAVAA